MPLDAEAWVTLNEVKANLQIGISETGCDDLLTDLINMGYKALERYIGKQLKSKQYTEYYDGDGTTCLLLRKWPIISIASIHIDYERLWASDKLASSSDYYFETDPNISTALVEFWQALGPGPSIFERGVKNIRVIYTAGYDPIPGDAKRALIEYVSWMFRRAGTEGTNSQSLGGKGESYDTDEIPTYVRFKLSSFRERGH